MSRQLDRLTEVALAYHRNVEGEYGCNGVTCPGVQRLVHLLQTGLECACVIGVYCTRHGFTHGAEAEELRERLGVLKNRHVTRILDEVDARDALAWCEVRADLETDDEHETIRPVA